MTKKIKIILAIVIVIGTVFGTMNISNATVLSQSVYFGVTEEKMTDTPNMGYAIGNPLANGNTATAAKIWEIVQYSSSEFSDPTRVNVYCVKAGVGFTDIDKTAEYNVSYNFRTESAQIEAQNEVLSGLINDGQYYNILALADLFYVRGISTDAEKTTLLENAGIYEASYEEALTGDEIEAVQQAALWYFTNYGESDGMYDKYDSVSWMWYTDDDGASYSNLADYNPTSTIPSQSVETEKQAQVELLYKYLIDTAKTNSLNYENGTAKSFTTITLYASTTNNQEQPLILIERDPGEFDLALRKNITKIDGIEITNTKTPDIDETSLETGTTATYNHRKDAVVVETGSEVTYNLTIYNEGEIDGRALEITDQLPTGLTFKEITTEGFTASYDEDTNIVTITRNEDNKNNLAAYTEETGLSSEVIEIICVVTQEASETESITLTNVAWISKDYNDLGILDRDSDPSETPEVDKDNIEDYKGNENNKDELQDSEYYYEGEEDDDDFDKLIIKKTTKEFDLKLIKTITAVNKESVENRIESIDITNLANGTETTATYNLNKEPVTVQQGDLVTYTFRIYNEGELDGYVAEITEDIPEGLKFLGSTIDEDMNEITDENILAAVEFNASMGWTYTTVDGIEMISTDYLAKGKGEDILEEGSNLIKAFDPTLEYSDTDEFKNPDYREISVILEVTADNGSSEIIRNEAAITKSTDENGDDIEDRDSNTDDWVKYEDDEDYDNIILKEFDLSLRKFIIAISDDTVLEEEELLTNEDKTAYTREPVVDTSLLNTIDEDGNKITTATYEHTKEPIMVQKEQIVVYMLRVYNEGDIDGYAGQITDYLPTYLEYVDGDFNDEYGWVVSEDGRIVTTTYLNDSLILAFDGEELDYVQIPIMCKVSSSSNNNENITNIAEITEYLDPNKDIIKDRDSESDNIILPENEDLPGYKEDDNNSYVEGQEDDDDFEKVIVKEFNLALRKWVTDAIITYEDTITTIQSGNTPFMDPETPLKVDINSKDIDDVIVKFKYSIRVYNVGDIEGYVKEIKDYIPDGLMFIAEDNPLWTEVEDGIVTTTQTENILLAPNEYTDVTITLTWVNSAENMELKTNTAEISKDDNEYDLPDINSEPDNFVEGEDDIDTAPVLLATVTGQVRIYFVLGFSILIILSSGIVLIKKYVI